MKNTLLNNFIRYVKIDTMSDENTGTTPSTEKQFNLAKLLVDELLKLGLKDISLSENCFVYATLPANIETNESIGFVAHMDTIPGFSGTNVNPQIYENFDGNDIALNGISITSEQFPFLPTLKGKTLITTDGTTVLGADDKAGVAEIMTMLWYYQKTKAPHVNIHVAFTPDEEIGRGTDAFNYKYYEEKGCTVAYTLDGGEPNVINYENFNAASCVVTILGKSIHPGSAKDKMVNASLVAIEFNDLLPKHMIPSLTEKYEGFNHLVEISGTVSSAQLFYIIRNHDMGIFKEQKAMFEKAALSLNEKYGYDLCSVVVKDSYYNMKEIVSKYPDVLKLVEEALIENNYVPKYEPIRGGTDGARLTFEGIITPNLGTGGQNYHGPFEYLDLDESSSMINVVISLLKKYNK